MSKETINRMRSIKENYKSGVEVALINLKEEYKRKVAYYNSNKLLGELEEDAPMRKQFDRVMKDYDNKIAFHKNTVRYSIEDVITYAQKENKEIEVYVNMTDMKAKIEVMGMNDEKTQIEKEKKNLEDRKKVLTKTIEKKTEMFPEDTELFVKEENKELKEINSKLEEINKKLQKIDDEISMYADRDNLLKAYNANLKLIKDMEKLAKDNKINLEDKSFGDNSIIPATTPETTPPTTPLSTPTTTPIKQDAQILFDMAKGEYTYIDSDGKEFKESMFDENGKEYLTEEDKKDIINELISKGVNEKVAKKVDPYIYDMLSYYNPELRDQYMAGLDNSIRGTGHLKIKYDLRTRVNGKKKEKEVKYSLYEKLKMNRIARYHEKKGIAEVLRTKSKAKFYAILAALGVGVAGTGIYQLSKPKNNEPQIETEAKTKETDSLIQILSEKESETEKQTETQKETEQTEKEVMLNNQTEKQTVKGVKVNSETEDQKSSEDENNSKGETQNSQISQSTSRIGEYVTIKTGAHLYDDPYDAVKEQLQRATNGKIVVKTNSADRVYKVTKEGLYCPDGRCVEISNGNLETAMRQAGIDVNILKNIDTEALEKKGYKRMLHVVADGIAQWVEEGDSLQLQVDKFGNRIEKTDTEKQTDQKTSNQQVNDKELELAEETLETK